MVESRSLNVSYVVQRCFTPRGYERGRQIFFDSMSQAMPELSSCKDLVEKARNIDQIRHGERCSVREEIDSVQAATRCSTAMKAKVANMVRSRGILRGMSSSEGRYDEMGGTFSFVDGEDEVYDNEVEEEEEDVTEKQRTILCSVLGSIKEKCLLPNLRRYVLPVPNI